MAEKLKHNEVFIYTLADPVTHHIKYVGQTCNAIKRKSYHTHCNEENERSKWIQSLRSIGMKPVFEPIDVVDKKKWEFWEQYYISLFKSWGFLLTNIEFGGAGKNRIPKQTREKQSKARLGVLPSEDTRRKMSLARIGKPVDVSVCRKISIAKKGMISTFLNKKHRKESKEIIGRKNSKKLKNSKGEIFGSIGKAAISYGLKRTTLNAMLSGQLANKTDLKYS